MDAIHHNASALRSLAESIRRHLNDDTPRPGPGPWLEMLRRVKSHQVWVELNRPDMGPMIPYTRSLDLECPPLDGPWAHRLPDELELVAASLEPAVADAMDTAPKVVDGPAPPNLMWRNGQRYELPPTLWRLADFLWSRDKATFSALTEAVWDGDHVQDHTITATVSKLQAKLVEFGFQISLNVKSAHVIKTVADRRLVADP